MSQNDDGNVKIRTSVELPKEDQVVAVEEEEVTTTRNANGIVSPLSYQSKDNEEERKEEEEQVIIRHYTGDFGASFQDKTHKHEFELLYKDESTSKKTRNTLSSHNNPSCSHCIRQTRRQKRPRWESNNLFQSKMTDTGQHSIEFTPFQGSVLDLVQHTQTFSTTAGPSLPESSRSQVMVKLLWPSAIMYTVQAVAVIILVILILNQWFRKKNVVSHPRTSYYQSRSSFGEQHLQPQLQSQPQPQPQKKLQSIKQDLDSMRIIDSSNLEDSEPNDSDIIHKDKYDSSITSDSTVFSVAIPAMAEIISKTGLNRQDSLRIATEQVLSAQRRDYEKLQEEKLEKLKRIKEITEMEMTRLHKCMVSTMIGYNMICCIAIGCAARVIANNVHTIVEYYILDKREIHNVMNNFNLVEVGYKSFVKEICQCSESSNSATFYQSEVNPLSYHPSTGNCSYGGMLYVLNQIGMGPLVSFLFSMSMPIVRCMIGCMVKIILVGLLHRILAVFHSKVLHQCLNLFIFLSLVLRTAAGKTAIELIPGIIGFNFIWCSIGLYYKFREVTWMHNDRKSQGNTNHEDYERRMYLASNIRKLLRISTCLGSIILGTLKR